MDAEAQNARLNEQESVRGRKSLSLYKFSGSEKKRATSLGHLAPTEVPLAPPHKYLSANIFLQISYQQIYLFS